jgi:hypothetical protein
VVESKPSAEVPAPKSQEPIESDDQLPYLVSFPVYLIVLASAFILLGLAYYRFSASPDQTRIFRLVTSRDKDPSKFTMLRSLYASVNVFAAVLILPSIAMIFRHRKSNRKPYQSLSGSLPRTPAALSSLAIACVTLASALLEGVIAYHAARSVPDLRMWMLCGRQVWVGCFLGAAAVMWVTHEVAAAYLNSQDAGAGVVTSPSASAVKGEGSVNAVVSNDSSAGDVVDKAEEDDEDDEDEKADFTPGFAEDLASFAAEMREATKEE